MANQLSTTHTDFVRFDALDSWRGLCACMIVFFHMSLDPAYTASSIHNLQFLKGAYIFVDFFFVLSGFVISHSYENKILNGLSFKNFSMLRLGRIYPLYIVILLGFLLFETLKLFIPTETAAFSTQENSLGSFIASVFLLHSFGLFNTTVWNGPSWSIAVEYFTYLSYFILLVFVKRKILTCAVVFCLILPTTLFLLDARTIEVTYDFGFIRCAYGFSAGVVAYKLLRLLKPIKINFILFTFLELILIGLVFCFICFFSDSQITLLVPLFFIPFVLIFSLQRGFISHLLMKKFSLFIGKLSYSIYMNHMLVILILMNAVKLCEKFFYNSTESSFLIAYGIDQQIISNVLVGFTFLAVIVSAVVTYHVIEYPCNEWVRKYFRAKEKTPVSLAEEAAF